MPDDMLRHSLTSADVLRPATATADSEFTLTIEDALARYTAAGHPRTPRSVQRYCAKGHLESRRIETSFGEKWLITPASVEKHIAYIEEVSPATGHDRSRRVAPTSLESVGQMPDRHVPTGVDHQRRYGTLAEPLVERHSQAVIRATSADRSRLVGTEAPDMSRLVARLESETEFLRTQIAVKDGQIKDLTERARETNHLIGGLQRMLSPLLGSSRHDDAMPPGRSADEQFPDT